MSKKEEMREEYYELTEVKKSTNFIKTKSNNISTSKKSFEKMLLNIYLDDLE